MKRSAGRSPVSILIVLAAVVLVGFLVYFEFQNGVPHTQLPITHSPTFLGNYPFILGSGNVQQNGSAYSYIWINASAIKSGDNITVFPAINVDLRGINENNFTAKITYLGSRFGSTPYWINFSFSIPVLNISTKSSQLGISSNFTRTSVSFGSTQNGAEFFTQISAVVNAPDEFECFFYVGNSSTLAPHLAHGPVH
ncbi:MAG: hypothetical protein OK457_02430 [Thaumarchaeota archaeon]|nr:hypothetical protein [Nitrososphaerota archaeon]